MSWMHRSYIWWDAITSYIVIFMTTLAGWMTRTFFIDSFFIIHLFIFSWTELDSCSYIAFCVTRLANWEFCRNFFHQIFVKYVVKCWLVFKFDTSTPAYFCLIGERDQISPMKEGEFISACQEHNIIGKHCRYPAVASFIYEYPEAQNHYRIF